MERERERDRNKERRNKKAYRDEVNRKWTYANTRMSHKIKY